MAQRYIYNDTASPMFVGGKLIPAGDGRHIDELELPPGDPPAGAEPEADTGGGPGDEQLLANLRELLANPLAKIIPDLADHNDETLAQLAELESQSATPRKTLLGAIAELRLSRAQAKTGAPT